MVRMIDYGKLTLAVAYNVPTQKRLRTIKKDSYIMTKRFLSRVTVNGVSYHTYGVRVRLISLSGASSSASSTAVMGFSTLLVNR
jgi:alpha-glucuronidase